MRKSIKIGIPALAILTASFFVGACAGGGSSGGERAAATADGRTLTAEPPAVTAAAETTPSFGGVSKPASTGGVETGSSASPGGGGEGPVKLPDVAALAPSAEQRVIQTATLSLTVGKGDFDSAFNQARTIAAGLGGFVTSSSTSQGSQQRIVRGTLVLRVPQQTYAQAITQLSQLGQVRAQQETGEDVSQQYVDLRARESHLAAVEAQLLGFLRRTTTVAEALAVQSRLNDVQLQLEEVRGQIRYLDNATSYATISVDIAERGAPVAAKPKETQGWSFGDAWHAAAAGFKKVVGGVLVALVVAGPVILGLALLLLIGRALRRRRSSRPDQPGGPAASPLA